MMFTYFQKYVLVIIGDMQPAEEVGGDYYDVLPTVLSDHRHSVLCSG